MTETHIRKPYDQVERVKVDFPDPGLTKQHFKESCDVNNILAKYITTGVIDHVNTHAARYQENSAQDYAEAMALVANANSMFEELPAKVRGKFGHDPARFLEYVATIDPENAQEALFEVGLTSTPPSPEEIAPEGDTEAPALAELDQNEDQES